MFVSRLLGGRSSDGPQQIDASLPGALLPAGDRGRQRRRAAGRVHQRRQPVRGPVAGRAPQALSAAGAVLGRRQQPVDPDVNFGKAYLAFTVADGAGHDVRAAYFNKSTWALEAAPLNVTPGDDAGTGTGAPAVGAAGDGVGIVAWGEGGHVYTRRVWGTVAERRHRAADTALVRAAPSSSAGEPGDRRPGRLLLRRGRLPGGRDLRRASSSTRVLYNRLRGSAYDGVVAVDGRRQRGPPTAPIQPQVATSEYGAGWIVSTRSERRRRQPDLRDGAGQQRRRPAALFRVDSAPQHRRAQPGHRDRRPVLRT